MTPPMSQRPKRNAGVDDDCRTLSGTAGVMKSQKVAQLQMRDGQATLPQASLPDEQDRSRAREPSRSQYVSQGATRRDKIRLIPHRGNGVAPHQTVVR
jgi:hypothetical protein